MILLWKTSPSITGATLSFSQNHDSPFYRQWFLGAVLPNIKCWYEMGMKRGSGASGSPIPIHIRSILRFYIFVNVKLPQSSLVCLFPSQSHPSLFARTGDPCGRPDWAPLTIPWLWKLDLECWWVAVFHQWKNFQIEIVGKEFSIVCDLSKIYSKLPANLAAPGKRRPGLDARV